MKILTVILAACMLLAASCSNGGGSNHKPNVSAQLGIQPPRYGPGQEDPFELREFNFTYSGSIPAGTFWRVVFFNNSGLYRVYPTNLTSVQFKFAPPQSPGPMSARAELFEFDQLDRLRSLGVTSNTVDFFVGEDYLVDIEVVSGSSSNIGNPGWSQATTIQLGGAFFGQDFTLRTFDGELREFFSPMFSDEGQLTLTPDDFVFGANFVQIETVGLSGQPFSVRSPMYPVYRPTNPTGCTFGFNMWLGGGALVAGVPKNFHFDIPEENVIGGGKLIYRPMSWDGQTLDLNLAGGQDDLLFFTDNFPDEGVGEMVEVQMSLVMDCGPAPTTPFLMIPVRPTP